MAWFEASKEKKPVSPEWQKRQNAIRSGKLDLHPEIKAGSGKLNITKHNPSESVATRRKRSKEIRSAILKKMFEENKRK